MGTAYYHRGVWNIKYVGPDGKDVTEALGQKFAEELLRQRESGIFRDSAPKTPKCRDYVETFFSYLKTVKKNRSLKRSRQSLHHFLEMYGDLQLHEITPTKIHDFIKKRSNDAGRHGGKVKHNSIVKELITIRYMYRRALSEDFFRDWRDKNGYPFRSPFIHIEMKRENDSRERVLTREEEARLLSCSPQPLNDIITVSLNTGMRLGEILSLEWKFVDFEVNVITLPQTNTKNGEVRRVPLNNLMRIKLRERFLQAGQNSWVFPAESKSGHAINPHKVWYRACEQAGIEGLRFHDLRHTAATRLVEAGVPLIAVKELLGHSSIVVTERYTHPDKSLVEGVEKLCSIDNQLTSDGKNPVPR